MNNQVSIHEEVVEILTYRTDTPEILPMFLEKRVYQGSSGVVYPYPVIEKIEDTPELQPYKAIFIENKYIKIMILPELGGRVQMAYDKIGERHFIYYNSVIKPALVGLTGPWISGGIEFNWPQHHRPSTFMPIDYSIETCEDGSKIVWVNERERMFHQKGMAGFKLSPDRAVLEIQGRVSNPTPLPQTFLWWANPAVKVNDHYQSVFPGDVNAVYDHGRRDVSTYPIATGTYYKMDYSAGVDISRYKNIPVPTSFMAVESEYNFIGGYENDTKGGVLHVANHHISPGKKQWTWGNSDFGQAWDRNLTDEDGPYIELMTGVYTDNQPDFSWLQPYEEKSFTQYFMPYREIGVVKNATADLIMNIEVEDGIGTFKLFATRPMEGLIIRIFDDGLLAVKTVIDISPDAIYTQTLPLDSIEDCMVTICEDNSENPLLTWASDTHIKREVPQPAKPALRPQEIRSVEQLYLTGLHLEQYRHATYDPFDYYKEALRIEPENAACNNAMGKLLIRKGQFEKAEQYLLTAIKTLTQYNPNPYDGEAYYNLGVCYSMQDKQKEAYKAYYKCVWNGAWQDAGYFSLARISAYEQKWAQALEEVNQSLKRNSLNFLALHLKAYILRKLSRYEEALQVIEYALKDDPFNFGCRIEKSASEYMIANPDNDWNHLSLNNQEDLALRMRKDSHNYEELMLDYIAFGAWKEALAVGEFAEKASPRLSPMVYYYKAYCNVKLERKEIDIDIAEDLMNYTCYPNAIEAVHILKTLIAKYRELPRANFMLGNLYYDKRQYRDAIDAWERAYEDNSHNPTLLRNMALAYFNKFNRPEKAVELLERSVENAEYNPRLVLELDQLYKRLGRPHQTRLDLLNKYAKLVEQRDDLYLEYVTLLNLLNRPKDALKLLKTRKFHPWEGGEGKVSEQYQLSNLMIAKQFIEDRKPKQAIPYIKACYTLPDNLGEGKLQGALENDFDFYMGLALEIDDRSNEAIVYYERASKGNLKPSAAIFYNDQKPEKIYYQALALGKLGLYDESVHKLKTLIRYGDQHIHDKFTLDYFAVSLPDMLIWDDDMDKRNRVNCLFLIGLFHLGMRNSRLAEEAFKEASTLDPNHQGIIFQRSKLKWHTDLTDLCSNKMREKKHPLQCSIY
ncbi:MAG: DUF5107 domain-containing protein [Tannerellaceae bacterium]